MTFPFSRSSSVTRWLLVVVGCAVLETAQPTKAAEEAAVTEAHGLSDPARTDAPLEEQVSTTEVAPAETTRTGDTLLIPGGSRTAPALRPADRGSSSSWLVALALCAGGAAWFWWRKRVAAPLSRGARERRIEIEESRPLGNRQYLVLASVSGRKFLLGVTPGSIQLLSPLEAEEEPARESV